MDAHHRRAHDVATLTFAFALVGCAGSTGQSATPTLATPATIATAAPSLPASAVPTMLATPAAPLGQLGADWRAVTTTPTHWGESISVAAGGPGWVALASASSGSAPTAWTSADGISWEQGPTLSLPAGISSDDVSTMTSFGTDVYAVGDAFDAAQAGEAASTIVWRSRDGGHWEAIGYGPPFHLGPCPAGCPSVGSIAAGPAGVVLAGNRVKAVGTRFASESDFWSTPDGVQWVRVAAPVAAGSTDTPSIGIAVAAGGPGFIAAGTLCDANRLACRAVTWTSADGRAWAAPADLPGGKGVRAPQLAVGPAGAVALGERCSDDFCALVTWSSIDGLAWETAELTGESAGGPAHLTVAGDVFLILTARGAAGCAAWTSTDGTDWVRLVVPPGLDPALQADYVSEFVGRPGSALAIGQTTGGKGSSGAFWISP